MLFNFQVQGSNLLSAFVSSFWMLQYEYQTSGEKALFVYFVLCETVAYWKENNTLFSHYAKLQQHNSVKGLF